MKSHIHGLVEIILNKIDLKIFGQLTRNPKLHIVRVRLFNRFGLSDRHRST